MLDHVRREILAFVVVWALVFVVAGLLDDSYGIATALKALLLVSGVRIVNFLLVRRAERKRAG